MAGVETDPRAVTHYREATAALTPADRVWLREHGWHDNSPKPYPERGWTADDLEPRLPSWRHRERHHAELWHPRRQAQEGSRRQAGPEEGLQEQANVIM